MTKSFEQSLAGFRHTDVSITVDDTPDSEGTAAVALTFSDGAVLKANYWRLVQNGRALLSSFDHQKRYGLPSPIDAKERISTLLGGKTCLNVQFDSETADLILSFSDSTKLQVFNFTGFEIWEFRFADGNVEYSNHAL